MLLDAVDVALHLEELDDDACRELDELLMLGGSVWQIEPGW